MKLVRMCLCGKKQKDSCVCQKKKERKKNELKKRSFKMVTLKEDEKIFINLKTIVRLSYQSIFVVPGP